MKRWFAHISVGLAIAIASPSIVHADKATAQVLFDEGRKLMAAGNFADACPKLEASQKQDPGMATQFRLAECYEGLGRTASAWANYVEVADLAAKEGLADREKVARDKAKMLEPKLSRLAIEATEPDVAITRDGLAVNAGALGVAIPVDPGKHVVEAKAPGRTTYRVEVNVVGEGTTEKVVIPKLANDASPGETPTTTDTPGKRQRSIGVITAGAGLIVLGVSVALAFGAKSKWNESAASCDGNFCDAEGLATRDSARSRGNVATIVFGLGAAAFVTGIVLFIAAPSDKTTASRGVWVGVGPGSFSLSGRF